jgi:hypothetical protein
MAQLLLTAKDEVFKKAMNIPVQSTDDENMRTIGLKSNTIPELKTTTRRSRLLGDLASHNAV